MEPFTHAFAAAAAARAIFPATRYSTRIAIAAGLVADVDVLSLLGGAESYFLYNRTATHSALGSAVLAGGVAAAFWFAGRKHEKRPTLLLPSLLVAWMAAAVHLLLDLCNPYGIQLLWPVSGKWFAWDLLDSVDPWILFLLVAGLLLPGLFRMVSEEIGARPAGRGAQRWAIATVVLVLVYAGARSYFHSQAVAMLDSRMYHGLTPQRVGAFPRSTSPLVWHGIISTENTMEEVTVPVGPAGIFDPDRSRTHFKPESSAALLAAQQTETVKKFVQVARFPVAMVERIDSGYRVTLRDLRFPENRPASRNVVAEVELDNAARITLAQFRFAEREE